MWLGRLCYDDSENIGAFFSQMAKIPLFLNANQQVCKPEYFSGNCDTQSFALATLIGRGSKFNQVQRASLMTKVCNSVYFVMAALVCPES